MGPLFFVLCSLFLAQGADVNGTVYQNKDGTFAVKVGVLDPTGVAWATFKDTLNVTGWGVLELRTNKAFPDEVQMYGAGVLEGFITAPRIYQAHVNMAPTCYPNSSKTPPVEVVNFLTTQDQWGRTQAKTNQANDPYWRQIYLLFSQIDGMLQGYNDNTKAENLPQLTALDFITLQATCDLDYIVDMLFPAQQPDWAHMTPAEYEAYNAAHYDPGHCSVILKLTPDYSDLFLSHDTWCPYGWMNRIYKMYYLDLQDPNIKARGVSFSSFPGMLYSQDDFYLTDQKLAVTETTNEVWNTTELAMIHPETLLTWIRIRAANTLSDNGKTWAQTASRHWTGTYTNQWMVLDYKKFTPGQPLEEGTFWVMEEIPSRCHAEDLTQFLERGDWRSYNVAFFPEIYNLSGYPQIVAQFGNDKSYDLAPRAKIMRRDVNNVTDIPSFQHFMLYNDYKNDPYSEGDPHWGISSRRDLDATNPLADGGVDSKIINLNYVKNFTVLAHAGPTTQGQPPFQWVAPFTDPHLGQPVKFDFDWVTFKPSLF